MPIPIARITCFVTQCWFFSFINPRGLANRRSGDDRIDGAMGSSSRRSHSKQSSEASWANRHSGNDQIGGATGSSSRRRPSSAGKVRGSPDQILAPHSPSQPPLTAAGSWCPSPSRLDLGAPSPSRPDLGPPPSPSMSAGGGVG
jgi:hypothetical protein